MRRRPRGREAASADHYDNGINTVRGQAVGAIGDLILRDSVYIERFETTLARMIQDPSVCARLRRLDAPGGCASRFYSWTIFILTTPDVDHLIAGALPKHMEKVRPIIERMLRSQDPDVAENGARFAALSLP